MLEFRNVGVPAHKPSVVKCLLVVGLLSLSAVSLAKPSDSLHPDEIAKRLEPLGQVHVDGAPVKKVVKQTLSGPAKIYNDYCAMCHKTGLAGAPKTGDKAAWDTRMAQGLDKVVDNAWNGVKAMPPKGNCMSCSKEDIKSTIEYMLEKSK